MANRLEHPPHLTVPSFSDGHTEHALLVTPAGIEQHDIGWQRATAVERHTSSESVDGIFIWHSRNPRLISALNAVPRVGESRGKIAVVGDEEQSFRLVVQTSHRVDVLADAGQKIDHRPAPLRIRSRRHVPDGLVQQDVTSALGRPDATAIHPNVVGEWVCFRPHLADRLPVDGDSPFRDQLFRRSP